MPLSIDFNLLQTFLVACEEGSFAKAGRKLYLSEPAVSLRIHRLEEQLGFAVFTRTGRGVRPTHAGELLRDRAAATFASLETAIREARGATTAATLRLSMSATPIVLGHLFPSIVTQFAELHPDTEVASNGVPSTEALLDLVTGRADCAIVSDAERPHLVGFQTSQLLHNLIGLALPPDHPLVHRPRIAARELIGYRLLSNDRTRGFWPLVERVLVRGGLRPSDMLPVVNREALKAMAKQHLGVVFFPQVLILRDVERGELIFRPAEFEPGGGIELLSWFCAPLAHALQSQLTDLERVVQESAVALQLRLDEGLAKAGDPIVIELNGELNP